MANTRRLTISLRPGHALEVTRVTLGEQNLVYSLVTDRKLDYPLGKSRIVYIGTTKQGASRVAHSAAQLADQILTIHGVRSFSARITTCRPRQRVKTWLMLERALLLASRERYRAVPRCSIQGSKMKAADEFEYFSRERIGDVLERLT